MITTAPRREIETEDAFKVRFVRGAVAERTCHVMKPAVNFALFAFGSTAFEKHLDRSTLDQLTLFSFAFGARLIVVRELKVVGGEIAVLLGQFTFIFCELDARRVIR